MTIVRQFRVEAIEVTTTGDEPIRPETIGRRVKLQALKQDEAPFATGSIILTGMNGEFELGADFRVTFERVRNGLHVEVEDRVKDDL